MRGKKRSVGNGKSEGRGSKPERTVSYSDIFMTKEESHANHMFFADSDKLSRKKRKAEDSGNRTTKKMKSDHQPSQEKPQLQSTPALADNPVLAPTPKIKPAQQAELEALPLSAPSPTSSATVKTKWAIAQTKQKQKKKAKEAEKEATYTKHAMAEVQKVLKMLDKNGMRVGKIVDIAKQFQTGFTKSKKNGTRYFPCQLLDVISQLPDSNDKARKEVLYRHCYSAIENILTSVTKALPYESTPYKESNILQPGDHDLGDDTEDTIEDEEEDEKQESKTEEKVVYAPVKQQNQITDKYLWLLLPTTTLRRQFVYETEYEVLIRAINRLDVPCIKYLISGTKVTQAELESSKDQSIRDTGIKLATYGNDPKIAEVLVEQIASASCYPQTIGNEDRKEKLAIICSWYTLFTPQTTTLLSQAITKYFEQYDGDNQRLIEEFSRITKVRFGIPEPTQETDSDREITVDTANEKDYDSSWALTRKEKKVNFALPETEKGRW